jgi:hypothetical protein
MKLSQNTHQRLLITLFLGLDAYRILIGSFFSIFVPQECPDFKHTLTVNGTETAMTYHTCTLADNVSDLTNYNSAVIAFNALTATLMTVAFIFEVRRENWMIKHLDVDPAKPDINLATEIQEYDKLRASFSSKNLSYRRIFFAVGAANTINIVMSAVLMAQYFDGLKTITTFATNALLIVLRVVKSVQISRQESKALSIYMSEPVNFNTIDPKYKTKENLTLPAVP